MSVLIQLQGTIEVRALLDGAFAIILDNSAPENCLALIVHCLQLQPGIVGIHCAAREKMSDGAGTRYHVDTHCISPPHYALYTIQGRSYGHDFAVRNGCGF